MRVVSWKQYFQVKWDVSTSLVFLYFFSWQGRFTEAPPCSFGLNELLACSWPWAQPGCLDVSLLLFQRASLYPFVFHHRQLYVESCDVLTCKAGWWGLMQCNCSLIFPSQGLVLCSVVTWVKSSGGIWPFGESGLFPSIHALWSRCCCVWRDCQQCSQWFKTRDPLGPRGVVGRPGEAVWDRPAPGLAAGSVPVPRCCFGPDLPLGCCQAWVGAGRLAPGVALAFLGKVSPSPEPCGGLRVGDRGRHLRPLSLRAAVSTSRWREGNAWNMLAQGFLLGCSYRFYWEIALEIPPF